MDYMIDWLLEGEPWVEFRTRVDLIGQGENESDVIIARKKMINHPKIQSILNELTNWPGQVLSSHKSAKQSFHKLSFIADIGLKKGDPRIDEIIERILKHQSDEGPFQLPTKISKSYGGSGEEQWAWALCDAPLIVYSLAKFGLDEDERIQKAVRYLVGLVRENGWPCVVSKELGKFRGPGRKDDPCPFANLGMLKMLAQFEQWKTKKEAHIGVECILDLWKRSKEVHPYMFYMGTDFRKIKAPFIWYDILHVLDVLSQFDWLRNDPRLLEMFELVKSKGNNEEKFIPESTWREWKDWDFGQKKEPSRWLTFLVMRILKRID